MKPVNMAKSFLLAIVIVGCVHGPVKLNTEPTTSAIRAADEVGAAKVPQAALHLQLAKEELEQAKGLAEKGKKEEAEGMLLRADADAELSVSLSHQEAAKMEAEQALEKVRKLEEESKLPTKGGNP